MLVVGAAVVVVGGRADISALRRLLMYLQAALRNGRKCIVDILLTAHGEKALRDALRDIVDALKRVATLLVVGQDHIDLVG